MSNVVTFSSDTGLRVSALLGDGVPKPISGYGGWEVVDRPHRIGATQWKGRDPFRMDIPILFDGWAAGQSVDHEIHVLEMMAGLGGSRPPIISISGDVPRTDLDWVIESLDWGDVAISSNNGRLRQDFTVHLLQYLHDVTITETVSRPGVPSTYRTKQGDTLQKIAIKYYGNESFWRDIAVANDIRDPSTVPPGTVLTLP